MSWMLHAISFHEVETGVDLDLEEVVQGWLVLLVVSSTNHVELAERTIDGLEVMWELVSGLTFVYLA